MLFHSFNYFPSAKTTTNSYRNYPIKTQSKKKQRNKNLLQQMNKKKKINKDIPQFFSLVPAH